ncbi:hypothetical protein [uncultured Microbacterium sp.]|uniref:hypothetical protein n=1 Tax=uncultured Microbacterium sp. TaxID=191216 RepID=UPI0028D1E2D9|nr:hypothetical protein [uncultured Microbacterium sp.]
MREAAAATVEGAGDLVVGLTTTMTVCVALMIWIGLLGRASRATLLWTFALFLGLLGSYGTLASAAMGTDVLLHPVGFGIMFGMPLVIWSGLRAAQGKRSLAWMGFAQSLVSVVLLALTTNLPNGFTVFRWLFFASAIGAILGAIEVLRGTFRGSRFGVPLVVGSAALVLLGAVGAAGDVGNSSPEADLVYIRGVVIAMSVYAICATVSLLFLANRRPGARDALEAMDAFAIEPMMRAVVRERLLRARRRKEQSWSFIDLRLDDARDLRDATGDAAFGATIRRFENIVAETFPSDVDLCRVAPGHVTVFASQPAGAVREFVRTVLNEVSTADGEAPTSLRISASAGIVPVDVATASYESLVDAAALLVQDAQSEGGDRWRRAEAAAAS